MPVIFANPSKKKLEIISFLLSNSNDEKRVGNYVFLGYITQASSGFVDQTHPNYNLPVPQQYSSATPAFAENVAVSSPHPQNYANYVQSVPSPYAIRLTEVTILNFQLLHRPFCIIVRATVL